jgi:hypothetical protein
MKNNRKNVFIYQFGKVASLSLHYSLERYVNSVHVHDYKEMRNLVNKKPDDKYFIINIVRNFFDRNISAYFQNIDNENHLIWYAGNKSHVNSLSVEELHNDFREKNIAMLGFLENWYYHFNVTLNIDIYNFEFNKKNGFIILENEKFRILILRYEHIEIWENIIKEFLKLEEWKMVNENISNKKWYSKIYDEFKETYKFSRDENAIIMNSRVMNYFYEKEELQYFLMKYDANKKQGSKTNSKLLRFASILKDKTIFG